MPAGNRSGVGLTPPSAPYSIPQLWEQVRNVQMVMSPLRRWQGTGLLLPEHQLGRGQGCILFAATLTTFSGKQPMQPTRQAPQRLSSPDRPGRRNTSAVFSPPPTTTRAGSTVSVAFVSVQCHCYCGRQEDTCHQFGEAARSSP